MSAHQQDAPLTVVNSSSSSLRAAIDELRQRHQNSEKKQRRLLGRDLAQLEQDLKSAGPLETVEFVGRLVAALDESDSLVAASIEALERSERSLDECQRRLAEQQRVLDATDGQ